MWMVIGAERDEIFTHVRDERMLFVHAVGASFGSWIKEQGIFMCSESK